MRKKKCASITGLVSEYHFAIVRCAFTTASFLQPCEKVPSLETAVCYVHFDRLGGIYTLYIRISYVLGAIFNPLPSYLPLNNFPLMQCSFNKRISNFYQRGKNPWNVLFIVVGSFHDLTYFKFAAISQISAFFRKHNPLNRSLYYLEDV